MNEQADQQNWDPTFFMIRYNTAAVNRVCPLCGARTNPAVGYELFLMIPKALVASSAGSVDASMYLDLLPC